MLASFYETRDLGPTDRTYPDRCRVATQWEGGTVEKDNPGVIARPLIYLGALALGLGLHAASRVTALPATAARVLGVVLIACAVAVAVPAFRAMARAGTSFRTERPTTAIVTDGPFRYTRNPIYVALTLLYVGIGMVLNALWVLLLIVPVIVVMQLGVIAREERYLERKFGDEYRRYKVRVRRWL
jgi:protein-S-isoprenylcysteine O-methyltransferase Ste14